MIAAQAMPSLHHVIALGIVLLAAVALVGLYFAGRQMRSGMGRIMQQVSVVLLALLIGHLVLLVLARPLERLFQPLMPPLGISARQRALPNELAERLQLTQREGIEVTSVSAHARAASESLRPGDILLEIEGRTVDQPADVRHALRARGVGAGTLLRMRRLRGEETTDIWLRVTRADVRAVSWYLPQLLAAILACVAVWVVAFALLNTLPPAARKRFTVIATFTAGLFYPIEYFLPARHWLVWWRPGHTNPLSEWLSPWGTAAEVIAGFAIGMGVINLVIIHGKTVARGRRGWPNSIAFFWGLVAMLVFGIWQAYLPPTARPDHIVKVIYDYLFHGFYVPLGAAVFSVLAFYIATAAYRAFRIRTAEAGFMMGAAFIVMLGQIPFGMWLTSWIPSESAWAPLRVENLSGWVLGVVNMAGSRAILFGVAVGALAMSLRIWLNLERGAFFDQEM